MKADDRQVSGNHYKEMAVEPWAVMEAVLTPEEFRGFLKGNIIKYAMRAGHKAGSDDAGKALHYRQKLQELNRASSPEPRLSGCSSVSGFSNLDGLLPQQVPAR